MGGKRNSQNFVKGKVGKKQKKNKEPNKKEKCFLEKFGKSIIEKKVFFEKKETEKKGQKVKELKKVKEEIFFKKKMKQSTIQKVIEKQVNK